MNCLQTGTVALLLAGSVFLPEHTDGTANRHGAGLLSFDPKQQTVPDGRNQHQQGISMSSTTTTNNKVPTTGDKVLRQSQDARVPQTAMEASGPLKLSDEEYRAGKDRAWREAVAKVPAPASVSRTPLGDINTGIVRASAGLIYTKHWLLELLVTCTVAPLTMITPFNREYQQYLLEIFHIHPLTKLLHELATPCITWTYLLFAAYFELPGLHEKCGADKIGCYMFSLRLNAILALMFWLWWITWGFISKTALGVIMLPHLLVMWVTSNMFYFWSQQNLSDWAVAPVFYLALFFTSIQTLSHLAESGIPPRTNGTDKWMLFNVWAQQHDRWHVITVSLRAGLSGLICEFLASPRILPMQILNRLYALGYKPEQKRDLERLVQQSMVDNNPALDYPGSGGSLPPAVLGAPGSLSEAKAELRELRNRHRRNAGHVDADDAARAEYLERLISEVRRRTFAILAESIRAKPGESEAKEVQTREEPSMQSNAALAIIEDGEFCRLSLDGLMLEGVNKMDAGGKEHGPWIRSPDRSGPVALLYRSLEGTGLPRLTHCRRNSKHAAAAAASSPSLRTRACVK